MRKCGEIFLLKKNVISFCTMLKFFAEKMWVAFAMQKLLTFFSKQFQNIVYWIC